MASQIINLTAGLNSIADDEPKEGRKVIKFQPNMGFVTGLEIFNWNSKALGNQPLTSIQSMWVDASNVISTVAGAQRVLITLGETFGDIANNKAGPGRVLALEIPGNATNQIPNIGASPRQGFFLVPSSLPFEIQIGCTLNAQGPIDVQLYNFNVFALGVKHAKDVIKWLDRHNPNKSHINTGAAKS
jgi:hypothetical protein